MKRACRSIFFIALMSVSVGLSSAQKATRIRFARRATSAVVSGSLRNYRDKRVFIIRVNPGQTLQTTQVGNSHHITVFIKSPSGEDVGDSDASCNNRREITPTEAGNYQITVVECQKAEPWRGQFKFRITVR